MPKFVGATVTETADVDGFVSVNDNLTCCPTWYEDWFVARLYVTGDATWNEALAACGANWFVTVNEPVAATLGLAVASPSHVAFSVSDCPGSSVSDSTY
jgi:hypothetical protein